VANLTIDPKILNKLACPACAEKDSNGGPSLKPANQSASLSCSVCKREYALINGIIDLVGDGPREIDVSQRLMESRPLVSIYEISGGRLLQKPFSSLAWEMETSHKLLELEAAHDLLDIACGTGNFTKLFSKSISKGTITAIDLSLPMLVQYGKEIVKSGINRIALMRVDVTKWPFLPGSF